VVGTKVGFNHHSKIQYISSTQFQPDQSTCSLLTRQCWMQLRFLYMFVPYHIYACLCCNERNRSEQSAVLVIKTPLLHLLLTCSGRFLHHTKRRWYILLMEKHITAMLKSQHSCWVEPGNLAILSSTNRCGTVVLLTVRNAKWDASWQLNKWDPVAKRSSRIHITGSYSLTAIEMHRLIRWTRDSQ